MSKCIKECFYILRANILLFVWKETDMTEQQVSAESLVTTQASYPITPRYSLEQLLAMGGQEIIETWGALPAASLDELQGHFMGLVPNGDDPKRQAETGGRMYNENSVKGFWLGKAYRKTGDNEGEGYNRHRLPGGRIVHSNRFTTEIGPSLIDGKPSLLMYYGAFNKARPSFVDEIRKLDDYIYLGVGSVLSEEGKRNLGHFALTGPTDEWVGGAQGEPVPDFIKPTK